MKRLKLFEEYNNYQSDYHKSRYEEYVNKVKNAKLGDIFEESDIYMYVEYLVTHGSQSQDYDDSFVDGDLGERIEQYESYRYELVPIDDINLDEFTLYEDVAEEYAERYKKTKTYPPLVLEPKDRYYRIIDGNHRGNGLKLAGVDKVYAFVGIE